MQPEYLALIVSRKYETQAVQSHFPVSASYLGSHGGARLLQEIPQFPPLVRAAGVIELSLSLPLPHGLFLPPQLLVHLLFLLVVARLAAGLQVDLVNIPVVQLLAKWQGTHLLHHVELARAVEVQDGGEGPWVPVKEVFIFVQAIVIANLHQGLMGVAVPKFAEPGPRQAFQGPPQDLVVQTPNIKADPAQTGFCADDLDRLRGQRWCSSDVVGFRPWWSKLLGHDSGKGNFLDDVTWMNRRRRKPGKKYETFDLCWIFFMQVPPWLKRERRLLRKCIHESQQTECLLSSCRRQVKHYESCTVLLIPFITFLSEHWAKSMISLHQSVWLLCFVIRPHFFIMSMYNLTWAVLLEQIVLKM